MKKIKILSLLMGLAALFAACENNENEGPEGPEPREQVGRTVLVYIVGDNGVSELSSLFKVNFSDMKRVWKRLIIPSVIWLFIVRW
ncbi:hypothetical protein NXW50_18500 [Bacteroides thetaiotaomicron]|nr:hypothetical protein [Bacteroides thetaiotaomicron]MCS2280091.1 hypothetical protein [Bacteroides thetaiotaomicron]